MNKMSIWGWKNLLKFPSPNRLIACFGIKTQSRENRKMVFSGRTGKGWILTKKGSLIDYVKKGREIVILLW